MNALFENAYYRDEQWAKHYSAFVRYRNPVVIIVSIIFCLYFILAVCNLIFYMYINWLYTLLPFFWFGYLIFSYVRTYKLVLARDFETRGELAYIRTYVYEDRIEVFASDSSQIHLNFYDIKKVSGDGDYIYIITNSKLLYTFKRDSFTIGNDQYFLQFLRSKGLKVRCR